MENFDLNHKVFLVSGASSGIGRQTAISISRNNGRLIITGRDEKRLEETFQKLEGDGHLAFNADLTSEEEIDKLLVGIPPIDGFVHSAGISPLLPARFIKSTNIDEVFRLNYFAAVLITSKLLAEKKLKDNSSIVFVSSIASKYAYFGGSLYGSSKAALEAHCRYLALELAPRKIRCNCVAPTFVRTSMVDKTEETISTETLNMFEKMHPLGFGETTDVADSILFLLSDKAKWITGASLNMGGI